MPPLNEAFFEDTRIGKVKFYFTNPRHVPKGIPKKDRESDDVMDTSHAVAALIMGKGELGTTGRIREGRVDTGIPVLRNVGPTIISQLRRGFADNGFALASPYYYFQKPREKNQKGKYVVCLNFVKGAERKEFSHAVNQGLRDLAKFVWGYCHLWSNPDGSVTVNMVHLKNPVKDPPKYVLIFKRGGFDLTKVAGYTANQDPEGIETGTSVTVDANPLLTSEAAKECGFTPFDEKLREIAALL